MCFIKFILWELTALCVCAGLYLHGSTAAIFMFVAAFLIMPLPQLRKFLERIMGKLLRIVLIVGLILAALFLSPEIMTFVLNLFA